MGTEVPEAEAVVVALSVAGSGADAESAPGAGLEGVGFGLQATRLNVMSIGENTEFFMGNSTTVACGHREAYEICFSQRERNIANPMQ